MISVPWDARKKINEVGAFEKSYIGPEGQDKHVGP
jgi:hypothetical protein